MGATPLPSAGSDVQFPGAGAGKLFVDKVIDPSGAPLDVLDNNVGATVEGRVELPAWLVGSGVVTINIDEIGGPIDLEAGRTTFSVTGGTSPGTMIYPWSAPIPPNAVTPVTPPGAAPEVDKMYHIGVVFMLQTLAGVHTDIAGFYDLGTYLVV